MSIQLLGDAQRIAGGGDRRHCSLIAKMPSRKGRSVHEAALRRVGRKQIDSHTAARPRHCHGLVAGRNSAIGPGWPAGSGGFEGASNSGRRRIAYQQPRPLGLHRAGAPGAGIDHYSGHWPEQAQWPVVWFSSAVYWLPAIIAAYRIPGLASGLRAGDDRSQRGGEEEESRRGSM